MNKYKDIEYELIRRNRKTSSIIVEADGKVKVTIPENFTVEEIEKIIQSKLGWIYTKQSEFEDLNSARVNRQFRSGQGFLYLGSSYKLEVTEETDMDLKFYRGKFYIRKSKINEGKDLFKVFYKEKGIKKIEQIVNKYKKQMGVSPKSIRIMELQNRWGSCSDEGNLNFNWKCIMAPLTIIDYIVVHELAHLTNKSHDDEFWNSIDKVIPDYEIRKNWLRDKGASLDI